MRLFDQIKNKDVLLVVLFFDTVYQNPLKTPFFVSLKPLIKCTDIENALN